MWCEDRGHRACQMKFKKIERFEKQRSYVALASDAAAIPLKERQHLREDPEIFAGAREGEEGETALWERQATPDQRHRRDAQQRAKGGTGRGKSGRKMMQTKQRII